MGGDQSVLNRGQQGIQLKTQNPNNGLLKATTNTHGEVDPPPGYPYAINSTVSTFVAEIIIIILLAIETIIGTFSLIVSMRILSQETVIIVNLDKFDFEKRFKSHENSISLNNSRFSNRGTTYALPYYISK